MAASRSNNFASARTGGASRGNSGQDRPDLPAALTPSPVTAGDFLNRARPNTFGYGLIESPTMWIGMGQLVRDTNPLAALPRRVFMAYGGKENDGEAGTQKMIWLIRRVEQNFRAAGYDDASFLFVLDPDAKHDEPAWAKRFPDALKFLFADWKPQPTR